MDDFSTLREPRWNRGYNLGRSGTYPSIPMNRITTIGGHTDLQASVREAFSPPWNLTTNTNREFLCLQLHHISRQKHWHQTILFQFLSQPMISRFGDVSHRTSDADWLVLSCVEIGKLRECGSRNLRVSWTSKHSINKSKKRAAEDLKCRISLVNLMA